MHLIILYFWSYLFSLIIFTISSIIIASVVHDVLHPYSFIDVIFGFFYFSYLLFISIWTAMHSSFIKSSVHIKSISSIFSCSFTSFITFSISLSHLCWLSHATFIFYFLYFHIVLQFCNWLLYIQSFTHWLIILRLFVHIKCVLIYMMKNMFFAVTNFPLPHDFFLYFFCFYIFLILIYFNKSLYSLKYSLFSFSIYFSTNQHSKGLFSLSDVKHPVLFLPLKPTISWGNYALSCIRT